MRPRPAVWSAPWWDTSRSQPTRASTTSAAPAKRTRDMRSLLPLLLGLCLSSAMVRPHSRGLFDLPRIECPPSEEDDVTERFACPTPDRMGRYRCIDDHVLCDGFIDCPSGEDEDRQACMFYKTTKAHLDILADALLRWARGR